MALARMRGWQQVIASLALVFFAFQSYLTQTHIHLLWHGAPDAYAQNLTGQNAKPASDRNQLPPADNSANCPICQDMLLAGHFTTPGAVALILPPQIAAVAAIAIGRPAFVATASHNWHGRAPPAR